MELGDALPSCFSSHTGNVSFFRVYLVLHLKKNFVLVLVMLLLKMAPK